MTTIKELSLFDLLEQQQVDTKKQVSGLGKYIQIDDNYFISHDNLSYSLHFITERIGKDKEGNNKTYMSKETYYYGSLKMALLRYIDMSLKINGDVNTLLGKLKDIEDKIENLLTR